MRGYNKVILAGNLTRDVEVREFDTEIKNEGYCGLAGKEGAE